MADRAPDIIALGEPLIEFSFVEDGPIAMGRCLPGFGGDASNFAVAAARAANATGITVGVCTRLGADAFGDAFVDMWQGEGMDTSLVERDPEAPTGIYFITREHGKHAFTYYRDGSAASRMGPFSPTLAAVPGARLLHVTGVTQGISPSACDAGFAAMNAAREAGTLVSYDPNYRPRFWSLERARGILHEAASHADFFFPSIEEAEVLTGFDEPERIVDFYLGLGAGTVALKMGSYGVLLADGERSLRIPAPRIEARDASGAGDTFAGAFAARLMLGEAPEDCARYAAHMAALSTTKLGCVNAIPNAAEVAAFIRETDQAA